MKWDSTKDDYELLKREAVDVVWHKFPEELPECLVTCLVITEEYDGYCRTKTMLLGEWGPQSGWSIRAYENKEYRVTYWAVAPLLPVVNKNLEGIKNE